ncbi:MAG: hypothetical protein IKX81_01510 [Firmicutes bacterium]|nr:hypothetical protein [Bacillota bacterium]
MTVNDILKIECKFFHGSMYGVNYIYEVTPDEVIWANYFKKTGRFAPDKREVNNAPIRESHWQTILDAIDPLIPELKELPPKVEKPNDPEFICLDGPNEYIFKITWKTEDGEQEIEYCIPPGDEYNALIDALQKVAEKVR